MNIGQSIRRGVTWLLVGNTGSQVLQFLIGIVLARLLVPADFGMVVTVQIFTGFVGMLTSGGMGQSLVRAKSATADEFNAVFTIQLGLGTLVFVAFVLVAPLLAAYLEDPLYTDLIRVSALSFLLRPFTLIRAAWLNREMQFQKRAVVTLATGALTGVFSIAMAAAGMGVWSLMLSGLAGALASNFLYDRVTPLRLRLHFDRTALRVHSGFGLRITTNEFIAYLKDESVNLILSKLAGPAALGLFNKAESLSRLPNRLITPPTGQTVFRAMSKVQDDLDLTRYLFHRTVALLMAYIGPTLVGLWFVAKPFIEVVYGQRWVAAAEPMQVLIIAAFFRPIRTPCAVVLAAQNLLARETVALAINLVLTLGACIFGLQWGLVGVAWALVATGILLAIHYYVLVRIALTSRLRDVGISIAPGLALSLLLAVVLAAVHHGYAAHFESTSPALYLVAMGSSGILTFAAGFCLLPFAALRSESRRWLGAARHLFQVVRGAAPLKP